MPKNIHRIWLVVSLACGILDGCGTPPQPAPAAHASLAAPRPPRLPAGEYRVDPAQSEIRLLVYRAGPLAHLGHNHVIVNREVSGSARIAAAAGPDTFDTASFSLVIPVAAFVVDAAQARREEGEDFSAEVPDEARTGTLHNLLGAEVLNAAAFAAITVASAGVAPDRGGLLATLTLDVAGHASSAVVPFELQVDGARIAASGQVTLRQTALGLAPFRALLGALAVRDDFTVKFHMVAVPR